MAKVRRRALLVLSVHERTSLDHVVAALQASALSFLIGVGDARELTSEGDVVRAFATQRPHLFRRTLGTKGRTSAVETVVALAVWAAPLSGLRSEGGSRTSLLTIVEKGRRPGTEPLCLHLVTGEPVDTRQQVASLVDAYLKRALRQEHSEVLPAAFECVGG